MTEIYAIHKPSVMKEVFKVLKLFFGVQLFFAIMMLSFNYGGPVVFGVISAIPPIVAWSTGGKKGYRFIFYFLCMAFVIGQRTVYIGHYIRIVPSGAILWVLAITCLLIKPQYRISRKPIPWSVVFLCIGCFWGIVLGVVNNFEANLGFSYALMMFMSVPAFFVSYRLIQRMEHVKMITDILALGCIFLSFLGISEYLGLGFVHIFSAYVKGGGSMGQGGFVRMTASFWGGPMMVGYLSLCFPLTMAGFFTSKTWIQRSIYLVSLVLSFVAIYLSGHRGIWLPALIGIAFYFYLKGVKGLMILIILIAVGVHFIPEAAKSRFAGISGKKRDSSSVKREERARFAWDYIVKHPVLGNGWGASGLVHSDYLQIWADTGLLGFLGLLFCFFAVLRRLFYVVKIRDKIAQEYARGFISSIVCSAIILIQQAWFNLPEQYTPFWVVMGLAYQLPNVVNVERMLRVSELNKPKVPGIEASL